MSEGVADHVIWTWDWKALCGDEGLEIWSVQRHDLGLCFQQLCLHIPILAVLAVISAYYFGVQDGFVLRGKLQLLCVKFRICLVLVLAFLPLIQVYIDINKSTKPILPISFLLSTVQCIAWFTHFLYNWALRRRLGRSQRGPVTVGVVWSLLLVLAVISLRTHYLLYKHALNPDYSVALAFGFSVFYMAVHVLYGVSLTPGRGATVYINQNLNFNTVNENTSLLHRTEFERFDQDEDEDQYYLDVALENDNWLSKLFFSWVTPLMDKGFNEKLSNAYDLFDLPDSLTCQTGELKFAGAVFDSFPSDVNSAIYDDANRSRRSLDLRFYSWQYTSLLSVLHKSYWLQFYGIGVLKLIADLAAFGGPILLNRLVTFVENKSVDMKWGYIYAAGLMGCSITSSLCDSHFNFQMATLGIKIRGALVTSIYKKTTLVSSSVLNENFSTGEILNLMSTDVDRIVNACPSFHAFWSIPFQIAVTLYLLYGQVGLAFIAGLIFSILLIPINKSIANKIGELSTKLMHHKDSRIKRLTEILRGIRAIKLCVWEQHFIRLVNKIRDKELKCLKGRKYLDALCVFFWATTPVIISVLTFATYVLMGNTLSAAKVFTGIALLNMLIAPLNAFPWVLNGMMEAWVSIKRIQRLLKLPILNYDDIYDSNLLDHNTDVLIGNGCFKWTDKERKIEESLETSTSSSRNSENDRFPRAKDKKTKPETTIPQESFKLSHLNVKIKKGEFVGVTGPVGSGKSSLLSAILGELFIYDGRMAISQVSSGFGFVSQQPWLQRGTIRDNILFSKSFDESLYTSVLFACGLQYDLASMANGDRTLVGDSGTTLSGGQRVRIALARAVYQEKNIYLLDDILSALDTKIAKHVYRHCIMGLLKNKTIILCTHHLKYLAPADTVLLFENGSIKQQGKPVDIFSDIDDELMLDIELEESIPSTSDSNLDSLLASLKDENIKSVDSSVDPESSGHGAIDSAIYGCYWKAVGHLLSISVFLAIVLMQSSRNMTDLWLSHWVTVAESDGPNSTNFTSPILSSIYIDATDTNYYLRIYVEFALLNCVSTLFRAFLFAYGGVVAATKIHKLLLKSVVKGNCTFFDRTPTGRILNRFSNDTYTVDDSLPFILNIFLAQLFSLFGCIVVTVYGLPWITIVCVPLVPIYYWLQNHYRYTSRELKRISSETMSPIFNHFNETLQGLTTIRGMRASSHFVVENSFNLDLYLQADLASQAATRWLGLRLQLIGVAIITGISFLSIIQHQYDVADPGLIGLAISYALSITGNLSGVVNAFTETEKEMVAVERVNQYVNEIKPEVVHFSLDPPFGWPSQGVVRFHNVVLKYQEHLPPSLNNVSFETRPSEKIGIVGRTGAGKSSLISALFRLVELDSGVIEIDCINIKCLSLASLRSRMFCIPQDPFLFSGTIRENLDPLGEFRDNEIWNALSKCNLTNTVKRLSGLEYEVEENGQNFSIGQKQLFCLARAILHSPKILIIDEATANVDYETDRQIQQTLRCAFRKCTVITIAHRLQTIQDCDRVLVMKDGMVAEFDYPDTLMSDSSSMFFQLINH